MSKPIFVLLALTLIINILLWSSSKRFSLQPTDLPSIQTFPFPDLPQNAGHSPWAVIPLLLLYTALLLAFLGMIAGEWLVPNLATLADMLGMSENTAGVTLLALGNGSPDVLSTYSAFTNNSGSLAIGELLGAAMFIITVIVGSMGIIRSFKVHKGPFLRDVGFAIAAVALLLMVMWDGVLTLWEAGVLVGLYVAYVSWVAGGSWLMKLRGVGEIRLEEEDGIDGLADRDEEHAIGERNGTSQSARFKSTSPLDASQLLNTSSALPASAPHLLRINTDSTASVTSDNSNSTPWPKSSTRPLHSRSSSNASVGTFDVRRTKLSLLGAVEFRDVVNSLKYSPNMGLQGEVPKHISPNIFSAGHYHPHHVCSPLSARQSSYVGEGTSPLFSRRPSYFPPVPRRSSQGVSASSQRDIAPIPDVRTNQASSSFGDSQEEDGRNEMLDSPSPLLVNTSLDNEATNPWQGEIGSNLGSARAIRANNFTQPPPNPDASNNPKHAPPSITLQESPSNSPLSLFVPTKDKIKRRKLLHFVRVSYHILFPSLQAFKFKSILGKFLSVLAVPAILALTLTLPVVDDMDRDPSCCGSEDEEEKEDDDRASEGTAREGSSEEETDRPRGEDRSKQSLHPNAVVAGMMHSHLLNLGEGTRTTHSPHDTTQDSFNLHQQPSPHHTHHHHHSHPHHDHGILADPFQPEQYLSHQASSHSMHEVGNSNTGQNNGKRLLDSRSVRGQEEERVRDSVMEEIESEMACEEEDETHALAFNKWLTAAQCLFGPTFCAGVLFYDPDDTGFDVRSFLCLVAFGVIVAGCTVVFATDGSQPVWRLGRCLLGFSVAMVWIMSLADKVVTVLKTIGEILNLSDAIIGLTVFAIGNSTADLVANLSIASFSPIMAFSACFGGPMLNILLGVGFSGAFVIVSSGKSYPVKIHPSLVTSGLGLLTILIATLVFVPFNNYEITKRWGFCLIGFYIASSTINVLVEIFWTA